MARFYGFEELGRGLGGGLSSVGQGIQAGAQNYVNTSEKLKNDEFEKAREARYAKEGDQKYLMDKLKYKQGAWDKEAKEKEGKDALKVAEARKRSAEVASGYARALAGSPADGSAEQAPTATLTMRPMQSKASPPSLTPAIDTGLDGLAARPGGDLGSVVGDIAAAKSPVPSSAPEHPAVKLMPAKERVLFDAYVKDRQGDDDLPSADKEISSLLADWEAAKGKPLSVLDKAKVGLDEANARKADAAARYFGKKNPLGGAAQKPLTGKAADLQQKHDEMGYLLQHAKELYGSIAARQGGDVTGLFQAGKNKLGQYVGTDDPEMTQLVQAITDATALAMNIRTGAASTDAEFQRLGQTMPNVWRDDKSFTSVLNDAIRKHEYLGHMLPKITGRPDEGDSSAPKRPSDDATDEEYDRYLMQGGQ